jgi:cytochrome P450/NADPH-cytochrome P450 reductase
MFDEMHDIATQLAVKWARFGSEEKINVMEDFTRLTLDYRAVKLSPLGRRKRVGWE